MAHFLIQAQEAQGGHLIPAQSYGYTAIEAANYAKWLHGHFGTDVTYELCGDLPRYTVVTLEGQGSHEVSPFKERHLNASIVPIGSVEFVLAWLKQMGAPIPLPLNVPHNLSGLAERRIEHLELDEGWRKEITGWNEYHYVKSLSTFKDHRNGMVLPGGHIPFENGERVQVSAQAQGVLSEWRAFVLDGELLGIRCYEGSEWALPNKSYIKEIIREHGRYKENHLRRAYTIDVMVYDHPWDERVTDIVELHDFFAVGLYGFDDMKRLPQMWASAIRRLLEGGKSG